MTWCPTWTAPLSTHPQSRHFRGGSRRIRSSRPFLATTSSKPARAKWDSASVRPWIWTLSSHVKAIHVETMLGGGASGSVQWETLSQITKWRIMEKIKLLASTGCTHVSGHTWMNAHVHERARTHTWVHTCTSIHNNGQELLQNCIRKNHKNAALF